MRVKTPRARPLSTKGLPIAVRDGGLRKKLRAYCAKKGRSTEEDGFQPRHYPDADYNSWPDSKSKRTHARRVRNRPFQKYDVEGHACDCWFNNRNGPQLPCGTRCWCASLGPLLRLPQPFAPPAAGAGNMARHSRAVTSPPTGLRQVPRRFVVSFTNTGKLMGFGTQSCARAIAINARNVLVDAVDEARASAPAIGADAVRSNRASAGAINV